MFHILGYGLSAAAASQTNVQVTAQGDSGIFTIRNSNFILTEDYDLLWAYHRSASALSARFNVPELNALTRMQIFPVERAAAPLDRPAFMDLRDRPLRLPKDEEIQVEMSHNLGAGNEAATVMLCIARPGWSRNLPRTGFPILTRAQVTATLPTSATVPGWGAETVLTFPDGLRGGWYTVIGAQGAGRDQTADPTDGFRLVFPRGDYQGSTRQLRPGGVFNPAVDRIPAFMPLTQMGVWGHFHSFEFPSIQIFGTSGSTAAIDVLLWLLYHGNQRPF